MQKLDLPRISVRFRGFTLPVAGEFLICDYDEVLRVSLSEPASVEVTDENPNDFELKRTDWFGVSLREPIAQAGSYELSYVFVPEDDFQKVTIKSASGSETLSFRTFSGDWFVASFSADAKYLILAEPYLLEIYALE
ncbi:hypothetical protein [Pseudomonas nitroreducens]|uniref:hypothetical protein n=1 Tax=Pseudomonas nitroreducens TaxID=46680 RepID=UPI0020A0A6C4|nr:hypothetical protein [Pseudomonas nitroreducens]MCP1626333.1 hypothetical protein [Pseudomonas nitroreducens]